MPSSLLSCTSIQTKHDRDISHGRCIGRKRYHCKTLNQQRWQLQKSSKLLFSSATVQKFKLNFRNAPVVSITMILMVYVCLFSSTAVEAFIATNVNLHRRCDPLLLSPSSQLSRPRNFFSYRHLSSHHYSHENDSNNSSYRNPSDSNHHHSNSHNHRRKFLISGTTVMSSLLLRSVTPSYATVTDPKTGISQPEVGEIQDAVPKDWSKIENPFLNEFEKSSFGRLDQKPDSVFYESPRFVEHIDENAVEIVTKYNTDVIISTANAKQSDLSVASNSDDTLPPKARVLDLCSSWTSHIDPNVVLSSVPESNNDNDIEKSNSEKKNKKIMAQISGLGMNSEELKSNPLLSDWTIQDLNTNPDLSKIYPNDNTFDVVFCQLSIDYLTRPMEVLREVSRILKVGGTVHIIFSNRLFLSKAVALWTGADDVDHTFYVSSYLHFCGGNFHNIEAIDLSSRRSSATKGGQLIVGDPVFVVRAVKG